MLSVIVDARAAPDRLAGLLAALTPAAVEGLVREVLVAGAAETEFLAAATGQLCDATGAEEVPDLASAVEQARGDWLLLLPAQIRFREGWVERLHDHLPSGRPALLQGLKAGGLFGRREEGVLIRREAALGLATLDSLRRKQGADRVRLD